MSKKQTFVVVKQLPTLLNRLYQPVCRSNKPSIIKSADAKKFTELIQMECIRQKCINIIEGDIRMKIDFCFKGRDKDIDSPLKLILDSLEGIMYKNDKQIVELIIRKHRKAEEDEIVVLVEEAR